MQSTENQKLREALLSDMDIAVLRMPVRMAFAGDMAQFQYHNRVQALLNRIEALALPTADHLPDAGKMVVDHFPDATKMIEAAAPVGDLADLPRYTAWSHLKAHGVWPEGIDRSWMKDEMGRYNDVTVSNAVIAELRAALPTDDVKSILQDALNVLGCLEYGITGVDSWPCEDSVEDVIHRIRKVLEESQ